MHQTFRSVRSVKDSFYADLQAAMMGARRDEEFVVVGDFNARIGLWEDLDDEWSAARGPHGLLGQLNSAGEELFNFLSGNQAIVCNTWFTQKDHQNQTWQHHGPRHGTASITSLHRSGHVVAVVMRR